MNPEKLTTKVREAYAQALQLAEQTRAPELYPEHLLVAFCRQPEGVAPALFRKLDLSIADVLSRAEAALGRKPKIGGDYRVRESQALTLLNRDALKQAEGLGDEYVSTEHFLLAMADHAELKKLLKDAGIGNGFTRGAWADGIMKELDKDNNKGISWAEFQSGLRRTGGT